MSNQVKLVLNRYLCTKDNVLGYGDHNNTPAKSMFVANVVSLVLGNMFFIVE